MNPFRWYRKYKKRMLIYNLLMELYLSVRRVNRYNGINKVAYEEAFLNMMEDMHEITDTLQEIDMEE
jgi:hypothetical protein